MWLPGYIGEDKELIRKLCVATRVCVVRGGGVVTRGVCGNQGVCGEGTRGVCCKGARVCTRVVTRGVCGEGTRVCGNQGGGVTRGWW